MKGGTGSVLFEWRRGIARAVLKLGLLFVVVLLVATALGTDVSVKKPNRTVKIERRDAARARAAEPTPARTPTPPAAEPAIGKDWSVLATAKKVGLLIAIVLGIVFIGIPLGMLAISLLTRLGYGRGGLLGLDDVAEPPNRMAQPRRQREPDARDAELQRLRTEVARLKREGQTQASPPVTVKAPEHPPHSTNGAGPSSA